MSGIDAVLVTGAGRGIGRAIACRFGTRRVAVGCLARTDSAATVAEIINAAGGRAQALQVDLADLRRTRNLVSQWCSEVAPKRLGIVLAAGTLGRDGGLHDADLEDWNHTFRVNVAGNLAVVQTLIPCMAAVRFGRIVVLGGGGAAYAYSTFSGYALSKVALVRAVENLHVELQPMGDFGVVCLAPGAVETAMLKQVRDAGAEVRTVVDINEPVACVERLMFETQWGFSGRFLHVRDAWAEHLGTTARPLARDQWMLRRIEPDSR